MRYPALISFLGGGQLARMCAEAAARLGIDAAVLEREPGSPAARIAARALVGEFNDPEKLRELAQGSLAVTLENEFVEVAALEWLERQGVPVFPTARTMSLVQDKLEQKEFMRNLGIPLPEFAKVESSDDVLRAGDAWGWPLVLKMRRNSYDGHGNFTVEGPDEINSALSQLGWPEHALLAEEWVPFIRELAVMVARGQKGESVVYPVVETVQQNHICRVVRAPATLSISAAEKAARIAQQAVEAIDGVGVFGVELFETRQGDALYNEIAPRPHNSGHYSIEGCVTSQFENHVRAVLALPLGSATMIAPAAVMVNLLGENRGPAHLVGLAEALAVSGASVHIYGKLVSHPGRKMGHVTALGATLDEAEARARAAAEAITI